MSKWNACIDAITGEREYAFDWKNTRKNKEKKRRKRKMYRMRKKATGL